MVTTCCLSPWKVAVCFPESSNTNTSSPCRSELRFCWQESNNNDDDYKDDSEDNDDNDFDHLWVGLQQYNNDDDEKYESDDDHLWVGSPEPNNSTSSEQSAFYNVVQHCLEIVMRLSGFLCLKCSVVAIVYSYEYIQGIFSPRPPWKVSLLQPPLFRPQRSLETYKLSFSLNEHKISKCIPMRYPNI